MPFDGIAGVPAKDEFHSQFFCGLEEFLIGIEQQFRVKELSFGQFSGLVFSFYASGV